MAVAQIGSLTDFVAGTNIASADVDANFAAIKTQFNALIGSAGEAYIGETANADVTLGLTINQGANDDQILALKSSDITHGLTSIAETDTFFAISKANSNLGGVQINAVAEDSSTTVVLGIFADGGTGDTTKNSAGVGLITMYAREHDGSNSFANIASNGNVFAIKGYVGGTNRTLFILDEDGDFHYDGADGGAFDSEDDVALIRAFAVATSQDVIRTDFDEFVKYNEDDLVRFGLLGDTVANGGLVNGAQMQRLLVGAVWQQQMAIEGLRSELRALTA